MQRRPEPISALESHLAYWLHYVGYRIFHELHHRALEFGVTAAESVVLRKLYEHEQGAMPSRLAATAWADPRLYLEAGGEAGSQGVN